MNVCLYANSQTHQQTTARSMVLKRGSADHHLFFKISMKLLFFDVAKKSIAIIRIVMSY